jgi:hypothetical protein
MPDRATTTRGRPRNEDTDRRILAAALRLLRAGAPATVTVEAVGGAAPALASDFHQVLSPYTDGIARTKYPKCVSPASARS